MKFEENLFLQLHGRNCRVCIGVFEPCVSASSSASFSSTGTEWQVINSDASDPTVLSVTGMSREKSGTFACFADNGFESPLSIQFRIDVSGTFLVFSVTNSPPLSVRVSVRVRR